MKVTYKRKVGDIETEIIVEDNNRTEEAIVDTVILLKEAKP